MSIILVVLAFGLIMCVAVVYLPKFKGLTSVKVQKSKKKSADPRKPQKASNDGGYVPPNELSADSSSSSSTSKFQALKNLKVSADDIPFKIGLENAGNDLRRRKEKLSLNNDPNNYDYDIDELIREEQDEETRSFYKKEKIGATNAEIV